MFKQMRAGQMPSAVASSIVEIASHMIKREYVKAHDAYITCAIGNAPWPMGITGTGVHERQGRQHIRSDKIVSGTRLGPTGRSLAHGPHASSPSAPLPSTGPRDER